MAPRWYTGQPLTQPGPGRFFLTTQRYPIYYLQITKCGSTFMRNLLYYLDHGAVHPQPGKVHSLADDFVKADLVPGGEMVASPYLFTIVRDPVDRFLSLYFDKIANLNNDKDRGIRERVVRNAGLDLTPDMDLAAHQLNALKAIIWIGKNLERGVRARINPHWQRQQERLRRTDGLAARFLTLDGLPWQLPALLSPVIPDIAAQMAAVKTRNSTKKPFSRAEISTPELVETIHAVYAQDLDTYRQVRDLWGAAPGQEG
jgi:hypothetical protein